MYGLIVFLMITFGVVGTIAILNRPFEQKQLENKLLERENSLRNFIYNTYSEYDWHELKNDVYEQGIHEYIEEIKLWKENKKANPLIHDIWDNDDFLDLYVSLVLIQEMLYKRIEPEDFNLVCEIPSIEEIEID